MIYVRIILAGIIVLSILIALHALLFLLQKLILKKAKKIFWLIPGILTGIGLFLINIHIVGLIFNLSCGGPIILYFSLGILAILALPNYLLSRRIRK